MKYVLFILSIISLPSYAMDTPYELPTAEEINKRLEDNGLYLFARKSNLAHKLDGNSMTPKKLYKYVQPKVDSYRQEHQNTIDAVNGIDHQATKVLDLVSQKDFDPNKPINKAHLAELLSMGGLMFKDTPDMLDGLTQGVGAINNIAGGIVGGGNVDGDCRGALATVGDIVEEHVDVLVLVGPAIHTFGRADAKGIEGCAARTSGA